MEALRSTEPAEQSLFRAITDRDCRELQVFACGGEGAEGEIPVQEDRKPAKRTLWSTDIHGRPEKTFNDRGGLAIVQTQANPELFERKPKSRELHYPRESGLVPATVVRVRRGVNRLVDMSAPRFSDWPTRGYEEAMDDAAQTIYVASDLHAALVQLQVAVLFNCNAKEGDIIVTARADGRGERLKWRCQSDSIHCNSLWEVVTDLMQGKDASTAKWTVASAQERKVSDDDQPLSTIPMVVVERIRS